MPENEDIIDGITENNTILTILENIEKLNNGPNDGYDANRERYISQLLADGYDPTEELIRLYGTWYMGKHTTWWCQANMRFPEFYDDLMVAIQMVAEVVTRMDQLFGTEV